MTLVASVSDQSTLTIRLHDGRWIDVALFGSTSITSDVRNHHFDLSWRRANVAWHDSAAKVLIDLLSTHSPAYAHNCNQFVGRLAERLVTKETSGQSLLLSDLEEFPNYQPISGWPFVQAVLGRWQKRELPWLDPDIISFLRRPDKWEEAGKGQYFALIANDPERGALTKQELQSVYQALNTASADGDISVEDWALTSFLIGTGVRPVQIARARKTDVKQTAGPEGQELTLFITLAKTREARKETRWARKCQIQLAEVLLAYLDTPAMRRAAPDEPLFLDSSYKITARLMKVFRVLRTHSDRLGAPIPLFPYRFRYTLGTRAIAMGASDEVVARLLTHTSLHCVQFYRAAMPFLQKPIRDAIGNEMSIIGRAFKGRMIDTLADASRAGDDSALITAYEHLNGIDVGACGTHAACHLNAPRACLICNKFEPFREAPWEALRAVLEEDLATESEPRIREITEEQIKAVDDIIAERDGMRGAEAA